MYFESSRSATSATTSVKTRLIDKGLSASHLVRFLGYGGALAVMWLAAHRASGLLHELGSHWRLLETVLLPLATLITVAAAHPVLLLLLNALLDKTMRPVFDWVFILGILASAAWLLFALFSETASRKPAESQATPTKSARGG